jgi:hypothetical protein
MRNSAWLSCLIACSLGVINACGGDDDDAGSSSGGSGGKGGNAAANGGSGSGDSASVQNPDPPNSDCPVKDIGPMSGPYAQKGDCCYRTSNKARIDESAAKRTYEYRLNYFLLINQLKTIDPAVLGPITVDRFDNEEQSILFRFEIPQENGKVVAKKATVSIGSGRYNCDGTYSFYSETAAPADRGNNDKARWSVPSFQADVHPDKTDSTRVKPSFKDSLAVKNRLSYLPYLGGAPEYGLDFEGVSQGFDIIEMPTGDDNIDCVGSRKSSGKWSAGGKTIAYGPIKENNKEKIAALGVTFCQLMAFGAAANAPDCEQTPRCEPNSNGCKWQRLPDSLCPTNDDDKKKWGCHLGYDKNPDNDPVKTNCSKDVPSEIDPDNGTSEGQCCDPLGKSDSGLPACNAWLQINEFVAAAVDITDKPAGGVQESCHGK